MKDLPTNGKCVKHSPYITLGLPGGTMISHLFGTILFWQLMRMSQPRF